MLQILIFDETRLEEALSIPEIEQLEVEEETGQCIYVKSEEGIFSFISPGTGDQVCGLYIVAEPDKFVEFEFQSFDISCSKGGLLSAIDGWELNGQFFPSPADHPLPPEDRFIEYCGKNKPRKLFRTSQNVGLLEFRIPTKGQGFTVAVKFHHNPKPSCWSQNGKNIRSEHTVLSAKDDGNLLAYLGEMNSHLHYRRDESPLTWKPHFSYICEQISTILSTENGMLYATETACNAVLQYPEGTYTLRNYNRRSNCSISVIFPLSVKIVATSVGVQNGWPQHTLDYETGLLSKCRKRGIHDFVEIRGGEGLDPSLMKVAVDFCGLKSLPVKKPLTIACGNTAVRLVSSGRFENSVTFSFDMPSDFSSLDLVCSSFLEAV